MRVGQKNKLTYRWARKGSRPRAAHDQRTQSTYLFGAVCPERGAGAAPRRELAETTSKLQERLARLPLVKTWTDTVHYVGDVVVDGDGGGAVATCCARSSVSISGIQLDHAFRWRRRQGFLRVLLSFIE